MTDIVKRLRERPSNYNDAIEAADEIERLQLELQAAKFCVNVHIGERNIARLHAKRLEEENARLRELSHEH